MNLNVHTTHCNVNTIDTHLRSQFIRSIRDNDIRERSLQQKATVAFEEIAQNIKKIIESNTS